MFTLSFLKANQYVNPGVCYPSLSVLEAVFCHKYMYMTAYAGHLHSSLFPQGIFRSSSFLSQSQMPETTMSSSLLLFVYLILASAFGNGMPLSQKKMLFMQMGWPWQCNITSPPQPTFDWQLCPGKLAYYLTRGILPSTDNQEPRQQNNHKWISAVNIQELFPRHWDWLEAWSLYSIYCLMQKSLLHITCCPSHK